MNAATYTAVTAASDSSSVPLTDGAAIIVCMICVGLIAIIGLIVLFDK